MSELTTSGPHSPDGLRESFSLSDRPHVTAAVTAATEISDARATAHNAANLFRDFHVSPIENSRNHELRRDLSRTQSVLGRWTLIVAHEEFRTVDLARVRNNGDWDATSAAEQEMAELATLLEQDTAEVRIPRDSERAKRRIMIDPTIVAGNGLVLVRRKRLMLATQPHSYEFSDRRPTNGYGSKKRRPSQRHFTTQRHFEVDKVSEFVLDVPSLAIIDPRAAHEVHASMLERGINLFDGMEVEAAREAHATITSEGVENPTELQHLTGAIEEAIDARFEILTPVTTTYYADRKYKKVQELPKDRAA